MISLSDNVQQYATLKQRIKAALYDYFIILAYLGFIVIISVALAPVLIPMFKTSPTVAETAGFLLLTMPVCLYFIFSETSRRQGTWGKVKAGIRVSTDDGKGPVPIWRALVRNMIKFLPWEIAHYAIWRFQFPAEYSETYLSIVLAGVYFLVLLYLLCPLTNKKNKTVYDWIAGTSVTFRNQNV